MMDEHIRAAIVNALYSDLVERDLSREQLFLAHYTSLEALEKIVHSDELWFSHPLLMNDHEEVNFGINLGIQVISQDAGLRTLLGGEERQRAFLDNLLYARTHFDMRYLFDTYVFCLSEHDIFNDDGRLSMWRGYGGNGTGATLIFDTSKMEGMGNSPLVIAEVKYVSMQQRNQWIAELIIKIGELIKNCIFSNDELKIISHITFERLLMASIFSKYKGFDEEKEYRVVYMPQRDPTGVFNRFLHYYNGSKGLEPRLRFKVEPMTGVLPADLSLEKLIHHIILGPSRLSPLARGSTARMLHMAGKNRLASTLTYSRIPYRPTL